jgi:hypothetical protein
MTTSDLTKRRIWGACGAVALVTANVSNFIYYARTAHNQDYAADDAWNRSMWLNSLQSILLATVLLTFFQAMMILPLIIPSRDEGDSPISEKVFQGILHYNLGLKAIASSIYCGLFYFLCLLWAETYKHTQRAKAQTFKSRVEDDIGLTFLMIGLIIMLGILLWQAVWISQRVRNIYGYCIGREELGLEKGQTRATDQSSTDQSSTDQSSTDQSSTDDASNSNDAVVDDDGSTADLDVSTLRFHSRRRNQAIANSQIALRVAAARAAATRAAAETGSTGSVSISVGISAAGGGSGASTRGVSFPDISMHVDEIV